MSYFKVLKVLEKREFGNKFSVERLLVQIPDGRQTEFFMRSGQDYAVIVPVLPNDTLVMVEQPRLGIEELSLEFPMGQVDGKENEEIAATELREETGYRTESFTLLGKLLPSPGWSTQHAQVYVAENLEAGAAEPEPYEQITVRHVTVSELKELIAAGKMKSMPTIAAFYMYLTWKESAEKLR